MNEPIILGVRHHSPACARLVDHEIRRLRPRRVLIEGPADMNGRLDELRLPHELPIALFTYVIADDGARSSWAPFCAHSPEWVALTAAHTVGAEASFIDLPGWHPVFHGVENRFGDGALRAERLTRTLCDRLGLPDVDAVWDHLFEQPDAPEALRQRLDVFFDELRGDEPPSATDAVREEFMMEAVARAMRDAGGPVVVICGGYHAPALRQWRECELVASSAWSESPLPAIEHRHGTYLIPFSFSRLDSFGGYESGMASPAYQDAVWREGPDRAGELMLARILGRLRQRRQSVSAADAIAATAMAEGLRRLRGHAALARLDLLDGCAAALVKDALEAPLPWNYRGRLRPRTDPILVEVMAAISGDRLGQLAPGTPRPPLLEDVRAQLDAYGLELRPEPRAVVFDLSEAAGLDKSRLLHRLRVLQIDGVSRRSGPSVQKTDELLEIWGLEEQAGTEGSLIEAGAYGATLECAVTARIEARLAREGNLPSLTAALVDAVFAGIDTLAGHVLGQVGPRVTAEPSLEAVGAALAHLLGLWRHDALGASRGSALLGRAIEAAFARALWLVEHVTGSGPADQRQIEAIVALRDAHRYAGAALTLPAAHLWPVMERCARTASAPPALRGAALGVLWSTRFFESGAAVTHTTRAIRALATPTLLGDFLVGVLALAREELLHEPALIATLDETVAGMSADDFLEALPSLRLAFGYLPPAEKEDFARLILRRHRRPEQGDDVNPRDLLRSSEPPMLVARGFALDEAVSRALNRYGLMEERG